MPNSVRFWLCGICISSLRIRPWLQSGARYICDHVGAALQHPIRVSTRDEVHSSSPRREASLYDLPLGEQPGGNFFVRRPPEFVWFRLKRIGSASSTHLPAPANTTPHPEQRRRVRANSQPPPARQTLRQAQGEVNIWNSKKIRHRERSAAIHISARQAPVAG